MKFSRLQKVIVVDDSPEYLFLLTQILKNTGLDCEMFKSGVEALKSIQHHRVDLIITDYRMPEMNGTEFLHEVRNLGVSCPVILISADRLSLKAGEIELDCCATILPKPIPMEILENALRAADLYEHHRDCVHTSFANIVNQTKIRTDSAGSSKQADDLDTRSSC